MKTAAVENGWLKKAASVDEWRSFEGMLSLGMQGTRVRLVSAFENWLTGGSRFPDRSICQTSAGGRQLSRRNRTPTALA
ncbi:hypothetical protein KCP70_06840 [Salmonella enterica subsp. enterica]|nr:hypothetical protein KCP70_06840 [Salmonella enterica subsp. enterica]